MTINYDGFLFPIIYQICICLIIQDARKKKHKEKPKKMHIVDTIDFG